MRSDREAKEVLQEIDQSIRRRNVRGVPHYIFSTPEGVMYVARRARTDPGHPTAHMRTHAGLGTGTRSGAPRRQRSSRRSSRS